MAADAAIPHALSLENIHFAYGNKNVLNGVSFAVEQGVVCGLFGPNGSGKTTLFRCCLGLLAPTQGRVRVGEDNVASLGISQLARRMAYVPQEHSLGFPFRVRELVAMGRTPHMGGFFRLSKTDAAAVEQAMELVGIRDLAEEPCTTLSGGQRQLAGLARAFAQETPLMLLDEPTSALDFNNQLTVWRILSRIAAQGVAVLVCCHDPNHILWFCEHVAVLRQGRLAASGPSRHIMTGALLRELYGPDIDVVFHEGRPLVHPLNDNRHGDY